ncbi:hypothetical protein [Pseudorhodoplanes sp.]|uniref:hypothetical protein n=1 Tax=Pseudorhodoplanes sp. TaxID=1934341 RepID=UPI002C55CF1C|nr:hypothetical protein [Pseudorhodoplanes sp.]HWV40165.1 hypothetical protein [Pseudorhodoplanes sp.]
MPCIHTPCVAKDAPAITIAIAASIASGVRRSHAEKRRRARRGTLRARRRGQGEKPLLAGAQAISLQVLSKLRAVFMIVFGIGS